MGEDAPFKIPEALMRRYRERLRLHEAALEAARVDVLAGREEGAASARRVAHALRGSGGTYGLGALSAAAARVEDADPAELPVALEALLAQLAHDQPPAESRPKVLVVEDDPSVRAAVELALASSDYELIHAGTVAEARAQARSEFALVILDLSLPDADGRELLHSLQNHDGEGCPVLVLTASGDALVRAETIALGAEDFVRKPFELEDLAQRVSRILRRSSGAPANDPLTGLPTRPGFEEAFRRCAADAARHETPLSLAIIDFDAFKQVNDTLGHLAGDALLRHFAKTARSTLRGGDVLSRWGGDEFVALFPQTPQAGALQALQTLQEALIASPLSVADTDVTCLFSRGVVEVEAAKPLEDMLQAADAELYRDKRRQKAPSAEPRVLLVDDDRDFSALVAHCFAECGLQVEHRPDAESALTWLATNTPEACFLDVHLPGMSGFDLLERVRGTLGEDVPVLMLTSADDSENVVRGFDLGADDYVFKPCDPRTLVARLRRRFDKTGRWRRS